MRNNSGHNGIVRVGPWQNGFFADFYFWVAGFFCGFSRRIFPLIFVGKKCPEKSSRKIPGKILQNLHNKNPRHISADGPGQVLRDAAIVSLRCHCHHKPYGPDGKNSQRTIKIRIRQILAVDFSPCRKRSPAKGVWQKSDEKSDRSVRKSDRKVTKSVPKRKKVIELLLPTSFCGTLRILAEKLSSSDLDFPVDFRVEFFLLFLPKQKAPQNIHKEKKRKLQPENSETSPRISAEALLDDFFLATWHGKDRTTDYYRLEMQWKL